MIDFFFKDFIYLIECPHAREQQGGSEGGREGKSWEPDEGLDLSQRERLN